MHPLRQRMLQDMQIRNFAASTQRSYMQAIARFAQHFGRSPDQLGPEEIRAYQIYLIEEKHLGCGALSGVVSADREISFVAWAAERLPLLTPRYLHRVPDSPGVRPRLRRLPVYTRARPGPGRPDP